MTRQNSHDVFKTIHFVSGSLNIGIIEDEFVILVCGEGYVMKLMQSTYGDNYILNFSAM